MSGPRPLVDAATLEDVARRVRQIGQRTVDVARLVDLIEEVAGATQLCALNVALEAAHHGAAGKAMGSLADELQRLAERSTEAARDVARGLEAIQEAIEEAARATRTPAGSEPAAEDVR